MNSVIISDYGVMLANSGGRLVIRGLKAPPGLPEGHPALDRNPVRWTASERSGGWILGYPSRPRFITQRAIEGRQLEPVASGQTDQMCIRHVLAGAHRGKRCRSRGVAQESMPWHAHDRLEGGPCIVEPRAERRTKADPEKAHLADRAGCERPRPAEPSARPDMVGVRLPSARDQEVDVEQMTHASSSRSALTLWVVIAGAPAPATSTGRPNLPRVSRAARGARHSKTSLWPSRVTSTLSPGRRLNAFRNRAGMTSWPLVESVAELIGNILPVLPREAKSGRGRVRVP